MKLHGCSSLNLMAVEYKTYLLSKWIFLNECMYSNVYVFIIFTHTL
uniref:Uncharacterized protein n=1 Tax=Anguilla anguilla TaxID=7936 RepID=A0A0E9SRA3_ANGAN